MLPPRKIMLDGFQKHLFVDYNEFCKRHDLSPSVEGLITFMIDNDLITSITIKRYTILQEFEELYLKLENRKTQTVNALSDKFDIPPRTIWGILTSKKT